MQGFYGMLDGNIIADAVEFVVKARTSEEEVPMEAIGQIMNNLSETQLLSNKFTEDEASYLTKYSIKKEPETFSLTKNVAYAKPCPCGCGGVYGDYYEDDEEYEGYDEYDDEY